MWVTVKWQLDAHRGTDGGGEDRGGNLAEARDQFALMETGKVKTRSLHQKRCRQDREGIAERKILIAINLSDIRGWLAPSIVARSHPSP